MSTQDWITSFPAKIPGRDGLPYNVSNPPSPSNADIQTMIARIRAEIGTTPNTQTLLALFDYYFAQFEPYITNDKYKKEVLDFDGSETRPQSEIFNKRFLKYVTEWAKRQNNNLIIASQSISLATTSFATFLDEDSFSLDLRKRHFNVVFYCIEKLLDAMRKSQQTQMLFSSDLTKYYHGMLAAQSGMSKVQITELTGSDINIELADPSKLSKQQMDLLEIEKFRQAFNLSRDRSRQSEANLQFSKEANAQFASSIENLFNRQELALKSIIKS